MSYIKLFFKTDDQQVSEAPATEHAVTFTLRADQNEVGSWVGLYALADDGYVVSDVTVTPTGDNAAKWQLAEDDGGSPSGSPEAYGDPLELGEVNDTDKSYFWVRAKATDDEEPENDVTVTLVVEGVAAAE
jgi:hypothetical protein